MSASPRPVRQRVLIYEDELEELYRKHRIFKRLGLGELTESLEPGTSAPGRRCCFAGFSYFTRLRDPDGQEVGRVHYLERVFGHIIGRYVSHIIVDGTLLYREGHRKSWETASG